MCILVACCGVQRTVVDDLGSIKERLAAAERERLAVLLEKVSQTHEEITVSGEVRLLLLCSFEFFVIAR